MTEWWLQPHDTSDHIYVHVNISDNVHIGRNQDSNNRGLKVGLCASPRILYLSYACPYTWRLWWSWSVQHLYVKTIIQLSVSCDTSVASCNDLYLCWRRSNDGWSSIDLLCMAAPDRLRPQSWIVCFSTHTVSIGMPVRTHEDFGEVDQCSTCMWIWSLRLSVYCDISVAITAVNFELRLKCNSVNKSYWSEHL